MRPHTSFSKWCAYYTEATGKEFPNMRSQDPVCLDTQGDGRLSVSWAKAREAKHFVMKTLGCCPHCSRREFSVLLPYCWLQEGRIDLDDAAGGRQSRAVRPGCCRCITRQRAE